RQRGHGRVRATHIVLGHVLLQPSSIGDEAFANRFDSDLKPRSGFARCARPGVCEQVKGKSGAWGPTYAEPVLARACHDDHQETWFANDANQVVGATWMLGPPSKRIPRSFHRAPYDSTGEVGNSSASRGRARKRAARTEQRYPPPHESSGLRPESRSARPQPA